MALGVVGERWSLLALREVFFGVHRFDQIARNTGASRDILATRLRTLVDAGVLERRLYEQHPPRHEYVLTDAGHALNGVLLALMYWGDRHVTTGPPPMVWEHACGHELKPKTICAHCGEVVRDTELRPLIQPGSNTGVSPIHIAMSPSCERATRSQGAAAVLDRRPVFQRRWRKV